MTRLTVILLCVVAGACGKVDREYATVRDARADRLFERGWLPDILPSSATNIRVSSDLDINVATGSFRIGSTDAEQFYARLQPGLPDSRWSEPWRDFASNPSRSAYRTYTYSTNEAKWLFMCIHAENCEECLWVTDSDG